MQNLAQKFSYEVMTQRNIGFVSVEEQNQLRKKKVFICGAGGMGGACLESMVRAGVGEFWLADLDEFEISNLNRQVFSSLDVMGISKVLATVEKIKKINPDLVIHTFGSEWEEKLSEILPKVDIVINGMDDLSAGIMLYREAKKHRKTVIDAYTSSMPSVTCVRPESKRPEERLGFSTLGKERSAWTLDDLDQCKKQELVYVIANTSSLRWVIQEIVAEMISGKRKRISFAPMVITTGNLMASTAIDTLLHRKHGVDEKGYFLNLRMGKIERERNYLIRKCLEWLVRRSIEGGIPT